jgi:hypothetical protein
VGRLFRLGGCRTIQELLEAQATEKLGREPYERRSDGARRYRNGYKKQKPYTAEGVIEVLVPQVRDTDETVQLVLEPLTLPRYEAEQGIPRTEQSSYPRFRPSDGVSRTWIRRGGAD